MNTALANTSGRSMNTRTQQNDKIIDGWGNLQTPYSQEAEEATLGAILMNPNAYFAIASFLKPEDFFILRHRYIFECIVRMAAREETIDYLTLTEELKVTGHLTEIGGPAYLTQLLNTTPTSAHAEVYARLVERSSTRRKLMAVSDEIKALALNEELTSEQVMVASQTKLDEVMPNERANIVPGRDSIERYQDMQLDTATRIEAGEMVTFPLPNELGPLKHLVPQFTPGDFVVISGDSGSGKSCTLEQIGEGMAAQGILSKYIHTEMSTEQVLHRRMARRSGLPYDLLQTAGYTPTQKGYTTKQTEMLLKAEEEIRGFADNLSYAWLPDVEWQDLQMRMRRDAMAGVKVFLIDHFQDITMPSNGREENTVRMFEKACIWLAAFAEKRKVVVIVASQENKQGKTKWTTKLKEKAVTLISIKREQVSQEFCYVLDGVEVCAMPGEDHPIAKYVVAKARFGKKGTAKLLNHGPRFRWVDPALIRRRVSYPAFNGMPADDEEIPFN